MKVRLKPSTCANKTSLTLAVAETTIEIADCYFGDHEATIAQRFTGPGIVVTRKLDYYNAEDRVVLKLEAQKLRISLSNERDLHRFAIQFIGPVTMTVINDGAGRKMMVMESIAGMLAHAGTPSKAAGRVAK